MSVWLTLLGGSVGGFLVMLIKQWIDASSKERERNQRLRALLTLVDAEIGDNTLTTAGYTQGDANTYGQYLQLSAWEATRLQIAELMSETELFVRLVHYYHGLAHIKENATSQDVSALMVGLTYEANDLREKIQQITHYNASDYIEPELAQQIADRIYQDRQQSQRELRDQAARRFGRDSGDD